jgi:hypothetical protein
MVWRDLVGRLGAISIVVENREEARQGSVRTAETERHVMARVAPQRRAMVSTGEAA